MHIRSTILPYSPSLPPIAAMSTLVQGEGRTGMHMKADMSQLTCWNFFPVSSHTSPETGRSGSPSILGIINLLWKMWQVELMLAPHFSLLWTVLVFLAPWLCVLFNGASTDLVPGLKTAASACSIPGKTPAFSQSTWMEQGSPAALWPWCEAVMFVRDWSMNCPTNAAGVSNKGEGGKGW